MSTENMASSILTQEEATILRDSWILLAPDMKGNGCKFLTHFFTDYPEYQKTFRGFADVELDELIVNKRLLVHGYTIMSAINGAIDSLDDPEEFAQLLVQIGKNHDKRRLHIGDLHNFKESLYEYLTKALEEIWSHEIGEIWKVFLSAMVGKISEGLTHNLD